MSLKTKADHESLCNKVAMKINVSSVCDIGIERTNNEDAVAIGLDLKIKYGIKTPHMVMYHYQLMVLYLLLPMAWEVPMLVK